MSGKDFELNKLEGSAFTSDSATDPENDGSLVRAILRKKPLDLLQKLLDDGHNINGKCEEMDGGRPLHAAVKTKNDSLIRWLMERGAQLDSRCGLSGGTPLHWCAEHQQTPSASVLLELASKQGIDLLEATDDEGETALHWARNGMLMTKFLVKRGANIRAEDEHGITPFARAIRVQSEKVVAWYLKKFPKEEIFEFFASTSEAKNENIILLIKMTPLAALKFFDMCVLFDGCMPDGQWIYTYRYDIVDPEPRKLVSKKDKDLPSAIEAIVSKRRKELIAHPLLQSILQRKWKLYIRQRFALSFLGYFIFLAAFSYALFSVDSIETRNNVGVFESSQTQFRLACEVASLLFILFYATQEVNEAYSLGFRNTYVGFGRKILLPKYLQSWWNFMDLAFFSCVLISVPFRIAKSDVQWSLLAIAYVLAWVRVYKYSVGFRKIGPFVLMLARIVTNDIPMFLVVYLVILFGFSGGIFIVYGPVAANRDFGSFGNALISGILVLFGVQEIDIYDINDQSGLVGCVLLLIFLLMVTIILLNLLIAQMNDTYAKVASDIRGEYELLRAEYIVSMDNLIFLSTRKKHWLAEDEISKMPLAIQQEAAQVDPQEKLKKNMSDMKSKVSSLEHKLDKVLALLEHKDGTAVQDFEEEDD